MFERAAGAPLHVRGDPHGNARFDPEMGDTPGHDDNSFEHVFEVIANSS